MRQAAFGPRRSRNPARPRDRGRPHRRLRTSGQAVRRGRLAPAPDPSRWSRAPKDRQRRPPDARPSLAPRRHPIPPASRSAGRSSRRLRRRRWSGPRRCGAALRSSATLVTATGASCSAIGRRRWPAPRIASASEVVGRSSDTAAHAASSANVLRLCSRNSDAWSDDADHSASGTQGLSSTLGPARSSPRN